MADDFDDLFKSPTSQSSAAGPSTPGWGGGFGDDDDLTTANPFADLQSSRLYESQINTPREEQAPTHYNQSTPTSPEALASQFEKQASLSRRSTTSRKASDVKRRERTDDTRGGVQRSNSTSSAASTASGAGEDSRTAPSSSEGGQEQRGDRVAVSPFIAPSDGYEGQENNTSNSQLGRSEHTIGESSHPRPTNNEPFWSRTTSTSIYDQEENATFGGGFHDDSGGFQVDEARLTPSSSSTPSFNVHHVQDDHSEKGFNDKHEDSEQLRARDTEDAASIRTVGLESDTASLRSHRVSPALLLQHLLSVFEPN